MGTRKVNRRRGECRGRRRGGQPANKLAIDARSDKLAAMKSFVTNRVIACLLLALILTAAALFMSMPGGLRGGGQWLASVRAALAFKDWDIPRVVATSDKNGNGVSDTDDFIAGGRAEAGRAPIYISNYYRGGYPPDDEGVCTDVIWRAFRDAGYDLKGMVDKDIRANPRAYPRVAGRPDPNIDFRRVPNLNVFFARQAQKLTREIIPENAENLALWQGGDIVVFKNPDHIAILSDRRNGLGIPLLLHNDGPFASEGDDFMDWYERGIVAHYRFPK